MHPAGGLRGKLRIGLRGGGAGERKPLAAAAGKIVQEDVAGIILLRDRKADLQRARAVGWDGIRDLENTIQLWRCHPLLPLCRNDCPDASYFAMNPGALPPNRASSTRPRRGR